MTATTQTPVLEPTLEPTPLMVKMKEKIDFYDDQYFNYSHTLISDKKYDELVIAYNKLLNAEPLGGGFECMHVDDDEKIEMKNKMLSIMKVRNTSELETFIHNTKDDTYQLESKVDGLAFGVVYEDGELVQGYTRGDGIYGKNALVPLKCVLPNTISYKGKVEVRGEVYCTEQNYTHLKARGEQFTSPRQVASAGLRRHKASEVTSLGLSYLAFEVLYPAPAKLLSRHDTRQSLVDLGLNVLPSENIIVVKASESYDAERQYSRELAKELRVAIGKLGMLQVTCKIPTDGVVVKMNNAGKGKDIGATQKYPKDRIAFKFNDAEFITHLLGVEWNLSKQGIAVPKAVIKELVIEGTTITRVALPNRGFIEEKGLQINSPVLVCLSGKVTPCIKGVAHGEKPLKPLVDIDYPTACPSCDGELTHSVEGSKFIVCKNPVCVGVLKKALFCFAQQLSIKGLGQRNCDLLVDDLFQTIKPSDLQGLGVSGIISLVNFLLLSDKDDHQQFKRNAIATNVSPHIVLKGLGVTKGFNKCMKSLATPIQKVTPESIEASVFATWLADSTIRGNNLPPQDCENFIVICDTICGERKEGQEAELIN